MEVHLRSPLCLHAAVSNYLQEQAVALRYRNRNVQQRWNYSRQLRSEVQIISCNLSLIFQTGLGEVGETCENALWTCNCPKSPTVGKDRTTIIDRLQNYLLLSKGYFKVSKPYAGRKTNANNKILFLKIICYILREDS